MSRIILLIVVALALGGCASQTVNIASYPSDAAIYANQDRIGTTPYMATVDQIMPLWNYNSALIKAVITIRKAGYEDYTVPVYNFYMPGEIKAVLVPIPDKTR